MLLFFLLAAIQPASSQTSLPDMAIAEANEVAGAWFDHGTRPKMFIMLQTRPRGHMLELVSMQINLAGEWTSSSESQVTK